VEEGDGGLTAITHPCSRVRVGLVELVHREVARAVVGEPVAERLERADVHVPLFRNVLEDDVEGDVRIFVHGTLV
jgi:hypothetical protein